MGDIHLDILKIFLCLLSCFKDAFNNKLIIVIAGFNLLSLRNAFVTKHYVTKFASE